MSGLPRGRRRRWGRVAASATLLLVGSAVPLPSRYNPDSGSFGPDKVLHSVGHAGLTAVLVAAAGDDGSSTRAAVAAIVASTAYGLGTEMLQESVPGRAFERGDIVAGLVGSILGALWWRRSRAPDGP